MKNQHFYPQVVLKPGREKMAGMGHPWIFSGAVKSHDDAEPGSIAVLLSSDNRPMALGFFNPLTDILFRTLTFDTQAVIDRNFWENRFRTSWSLRKAMVPGTNTSCRLINAEGDGFPGVICDQYSDFIVVSFTTAGAEKIKPVLLQIIKDALNPKGVVERSEGRSRIREGLSPFSGILAGDTIPDFVEISENGWIFDVDILRGQKTGFFLDQAVNRLLARSLSKNVDVLNCFSYTGAFSVSCLSGGAARVVSVDESEPANTIAGKNLIKNGYSPDQHPIISDDVFHLLRETDESYDMIILDPPAFAKSGKDVDRAIRGYREINIQAIRHLKRNGYLFTFSCSNPIDETLFEKTVRSSFSHTRRNGQLIVKLGPGPDHPTDLAHPEGRYLKGLLIRMVS